jgi:hypothetical protein
MELCLKCLGGSSQISKVDAVERVTRWIPDSSMTR